MSAVDETVGEPAPPATPAPRVWKFWGTTLWGLLAVTAMFLGQFVTIAYLLLRMDGPLDLSAAAQFASDGVVISVSVILGLPAVVLVLFAATRTARASFTDYLALRWPSWRQILVGIVCLIALVGGWDLLSRALGREVAPGFMVDVLKSARADGGLWLLIIAFSVAAPLAEELLARGFLYRGWSESVLRPGGAILLSALAWTALHLQYEMFFFMQVLSIGVLFGYLRYRTGSTWLTIILHGINNFAATMQGVWLSQS